MRQVFLAAVMAAVMTGSALGQDLYVRTGAGSQIGVSVTDVEGTEKAARGVVIQEVRAGTPAERAGLRTGDVVVEFDGEAVRSVRQFTRIVQESKAERPVTAVVMRNGSRQSLSVTPQAGQQSSLFSLVPPGAGADRRQPLRNPPNFNFDLGNRFNEPLQLFSLTNPRRIGAELTPLSDQLADYFGVKNGALVSSVDANSAAATAGLKSGDVIIAINGRAVDTPADVTAAIREANSGASLEIRVMRDKKELTLKTTIPDTPQRQRLQLNDRIRL